MGIALRAPHRAPHRAIPGAPVPPLAGAPGSAYEFESLWAEFKQADDLLGYTMRLTWDELRDRGPFGDAFRGTVKEHASLWRSFLPDAQTLQSLAFADPSLLGASGYTNYEDALQGAKADVAQRVGELALASAASASRQLFGSIVQTAGVEAGKFNAVEKVCDQSLAAIAQTLDAQRNELAASAFGDGLKLLAATNPVGWIALVVVKFGRTISNAVRSYRDARDAAARAAVSRTFSIPLSAVSAPGAEGDQAAAVRVLDLTGPTNAYDPSTVFAPSYQTKAVDPFEAIAVREEGSDAIVGWVAFGREPTGGVGMVPGTGNIRRGIYFPVSYHANGCHPRDPRDLGTLYPTAQSLGTTLWGHVLEAGPAAFTVHADDLRSRWERAVREDLKLAFDVLQGWSCVPSAEPFTRDFFCLSGDPPVGQYGVGSCKKKNRGKQMVIPSNFGKIHHDRLLTYFYELYFGVKRYDKINDVPRLPGTEPVALTGYGFRPYVLPDDVDVSRSVPVEALKNLRARQEALVRSPLVFLTNPDDYTLFPAYRDTHLRAVAKQSATELIAAGDWRRASFDQMPEGPLKNAVATAASHAGVDPHTLNPPCPPGAPASCYALGIRMAGPSVLGDPKPPAPPPQNDILPGVGLTTGKIPGKRKKKSGTAAAIALGAVGLGALVLAQK